MTSGANAAEIYSDSRTHGYQGPSRYVRFPRVTSAGGGCIAKSEDGVRCAVAGKESLRILRISDGSSPTNAESRSVVGRGGWRVEATRNLWEGCGLKNESGTTGIAWGRGPFSNKLFTSARNGELIMWDISRAGPARLERRTKDHSRSINQLSISHSVHHYCVTGSADGDLRVWDLRDMKSLMRVYHPTSVRSVAFSPNLWQPLQAIVGLDNGSIYRWDLKMGQRGLLDRLLVAHTTPVTSLSWCNPSGTNNSQTADNGLGWFASGALDRTVKVWDLTAPGSVSHIPSKPTYILHPRYPVRRILWRPGYECEIAVISNPDVSHMSSVAPSLLPRTPGTDTATQSSEMEMQSTPNVESRGSGPTSAAADDAIEIWDVRRGWVAKWSVRRSGAEGSLTADVEFADSHAMWTLHHSGGFSQLDLRDATKPIDAVPRVALTWSASESITFASDQGHQSEVPYDDIRTEDKPLAEQLGVHSKVLGDSMTQPQAQNIGTQVLPSSTSDLESFRNLAQNYTLVGENRTSICYKNAQVCSFSVAKEAGKEEIAQVWYLLAACLEEIVPPIPPAFPIRSQLASPQGMLTQSLLPTPGSARYSQSYFPQTQKISPGRRSTNSMESPKPQQQQQQRSSSRHLTPASSASSSPRHNNHVHLPPITPRRLSIFSRNSTVDPSSRQPSVYRRPSISSSIALGGVSFEKEKDANKPSLRHVGDGALSSDSSGNDSDIGSVGTAGNSSDEEMNMNMNARPPLTSPTSFLFQRSITAPSPLSRVAGRRQRWTTDEEAGGNYNDNNQAYDGDDNDEGSSASSDSNSDDMVRSSSVSKRPSSTRYKSRSRSSTVASLAAPPPPPPPLPSFLPLLVPDAAAADGGGGVTGLVRQASVSSVRTVVAGQHPDMEENSLRAEGTIITSRLGLESSGGLVTTDTTAAADSSTRQQDEEEGKEESMLDTFTERRIGIVQADEKRIKSGCLQVVKWAVEMFADSGEVQMCAFLVILARSELGVGMKRAVAFVEAYIDKLDRLGLFGCSAYMRKHCQLKDIQESTSTHTSISTCCGRCHKPLLKPSGRNADGSVAKGGYSYCLTCRTFVPCAICRLPVRTLFFQCPVCRHGAHEKCHQSYYEENRRRYVCPTGCGHRCLE
ncbi:hypothetical protein M378DRAFT_112090 [Amanita muscaria Koide BX008]|uniref:WDR59/RTC1-like RING zinc finger domain-containing protein n=1 Tax=Amanita muscaria (strain Koide BX008) TaxID=946122 RepID=A0A0C2WAW2_AMAMK|nr:hypothetical protein M378DRAFT_112090 [Amanita muscaria Koide BX008]